jgi:hypothetical protein
MPLKFHTQFTYANAGYFPVATTFGTLTQFPINISNLVFPQSLTGANWTAWANPVSAVTTADPTGLRNLMYQSSTSTGFYNQYRVKEVIARVSIFPETSLDNLNVIYLPLNGPTGATMGGANTIASLQDAPFAQHKIINQVSPNGGVHTVRILPHQIRGQTITQYNNDPSNVGTYSVPPVNVITLSVLVQTQDQAATNASVGWNVHLTYKVELMYPISQLLLD